MEGNLEDRRNLVILRNYKNSIKDGLQGSFFSVKLSMLLLLLLFHSPWLARLTFFLLKNLVEVELFSIV